MKFPTCNKNDVGFRSTADDSTQGQFISSTIQLSLTLDRMRRKNPNNIDYIKHYLDQFFNVDSLKYEHEAIGVLKNYQKKIRHILKEVTQLSLSTRDLSCLNQSLDYVSWYQKIIQKRISNSLYSSFPTLNFLSLNETCLLKHTSYCGAVKIAKSLSPLCTQPNTITKINELDVDPSQIFKLYSALQSLKEKENFLCALESVFRQDARLNRLFLKCPIAFNYICRKKTSSTNANYKVIFLNHFSKSINVLTGGVQSFRRHFIKQRK